MKIITSENFLEADPTSALLSNAVDSTNKLFQMNAQDWAKIMLRSTLSNNVPEDIRKLFETARGVMVYGYFFYPLFTLGCEQLFRVTEAASRAKCELLAAPKSKLKNFDEQIKFLIEKAIVSEEDRDVWTGFRRMRNESSHPKWQSLYSPGMFVPIMEEIIERINMLFE